MKVFARYLTRSLSPLHAPAFAVAVALGITICCSSALAQSGAGSIQGTVSDPSGAVIPGASITVTNQGTNIAVQARTNSVGFYQVPGLFTGTYVVTASARGMKTYSRFIDLLVGQSAVVDIPMTTGAVTQQVTVSANAIQLTTPDNGVISSTLENARINQLPMNGRNLISLVQETTPGLSSCSQSSSCPNGLFGEAMEYVADGASLANREFGGTHAGSAQMPDPDSVQEVRVETSGSGAQYATPATAVLTTKSGTNRLHGTLFETARNNAFGISRQRQNPSDFVAPPYVRNEFGASAGGPIILPHLYHGKNKSFWFFAYERYSLRSFSYENMKVPTVAMRNGDFSGLINSSGVLQQLYDPATTIASADCNGSGSANQWCRTPFAKNYVDPSRESPDAKIFNDITALPSNTNNPLVTANLSGKKVSNVTAPTITFRLDHEFNENNRAYLRYTSNPTDNEFNRDDPTDAQPTVAADGLPYAASNLSVDLTSLFAGGVGFTHIFSPTFFSETVVSQTWFGEYNAAGGTPNFNFEKKLGLPNNFGEPGFPWIGASHIISPMQGTMFQYGMSSIVSDIDENLTKTVGRHQMFFGARYRHERFGSRPDEAKDSIDFNGNGTGLEDPTSKSNYKDSPNAGFADADEFLGNAATYSVNIEPPYQHLHDMELDAYFQDDYHVRSNLTLNLGLRYEAHPALWSKNGMMESFDLKNDAVVLAATPAQLIAEGLTTQAVISNDANNGVKFETPAEAGMPGGSLTRNSNFTFGPRVGIAWQPFGDKRGTVLRGAYGRYIYPEPIRSYAINMNKATPFTASYSMNYNAANQAPDSLANYQLRSKQSVVMGVNSTNVVDSNSINSLLPGYSIYSLDPDYPPNYVTQTNFTIEQPMPGNSVLRLSYLYTHASNLDQNYMYNQHYSDYAWEVKTGTQKPSGSRIGQPDYAATGEGVYDQVTYGGGSWMQLKSGWSNDNIFQANYQRLFHHGAAYQISYDWQKPMRAGGNGGRDGNIYPSQVYVNSGLGTVTPIASGAGTGVAPSLPPPRPTGIASYASFRALNRYENYMEDTGIPLQHVQFNGIIDLPFGRGKRFLGNSNRFLDELVGGYQLAGAGSITSQDFAVSNSNWGPTNPVHLYKHGAKITDCRSGNCYPAYEWFNGYIAPTVVANNPCSTASGSKVVSGLPSGWLPSQSPIDTVCGDKYYGTNDVNVTLANGTVVKAVSYAPAPSGSYGGNPYSHTVLNGPMFWSADLSLFKVFPITERTSLRFNLDAFNAFNVQGFTNPGTTDGVEQIVPGGAGASSKNGPREIQLSLRLNF
jgi:hypothetical protein